MIKPAQSNIYLLGLLALDDGGEGGVHGAVAQVLRGANNPLRHHLHALLAHLQRKRRGSSQRYSVVSIKCAHRTQSENRAKLLVHETPKVL